MNRGVIILPTVVIITGMVLATAVTFTILGINAGRTARLLVQQYQALAWANACAEDGLLYLRDHPAQTSGSGSLPNGLISFAMPGSCTYTFDNDGNDDGSSDSTISGGHRFVMVTGITGPVTRRLQIRIPNPIKHPLRPNRWQEVPAAGITLSALPGGDADPCQLAQRDRRSSRRSSRHQQKATVLKTLGSSRPCP